MILRLTNVVTQCDDGKPRERDIAAITTIAVHRVGVSLGEDAITICQRFIADPDVARYTGGQVPYTFIIGNDEIGTIWQCLPLSEVGTHARRWSAPAIGVACIGDFRKHRPGDVQMKQLIRLCGYLAYAFPGIVIKGHDELPGGSSDPNKQCPGKYLDMDELRHNVSLFPCIDRLKEAGIEI